MKCAPGCGEMGSCHPNREAIVKQAKAFALKALDTCEVDTTCNNDTHQAARRLLKAIGKQDEKVN